MIGWPGDASGCALSMTEAFSHSMSVNLIEAPEEAEPYGSDVRRVRGVHGGLEVDYPTTSITSSVVMDTTPPKASIAVV